MITDSHAIHALLARLSSERIVLSVFLPEIPEPHNSLLLSLELGQNAVVIDELRPESGHRRVVPGITLRIVGRLDGVEVRFRTQVRAVDVDGAAAAYLLDVPAELDYRERRQSYRVRVWPGQRIPLTLASEDGITLTGNILDLSQNGLAILVSCLKPLPLATVWQCKFDLPDGEVSTNIIIRHVQNRDRSAREIKVGASYIELNPIQQRLIGHFATELQRRMLREHRLSP